jgi:hypothetical protein
VAASHFAGCAESNAEKEINMKTKRLAALSLIPLTLSAVCFAATGRDARFEDKEHLSAVQLYEMGYPAQAIKKNIGELVTLDVEVTIERNVPLVEITVPQELKEGENKVPRSIRAHLISVTTEASELKKGEKVKIEGIIVDEGFGAYTIYLQNVLEKQK